MFARRFLQFCNCTKIISIPDQQYYVTIEETQQLIDKGCLNASQRLIIALARYAGLRIPSELRGLRWSEVDWKKKRFIVHSPETERKGKPFRVVPIFPRLRLYLEDSYSLLEEGDSDLIFPKVNANMSTFVLQLWKRAGIELWSKPFQNMRHTISNEVATEFGTYEESVWIGHTEQIAKKHYRSITPDQIERATGQRKQEQPASEKMPTNTEKRQENCVNLDVKSEKCVDFDVENRENGLQPIPDGLYNSIDYNNLQNVAKNDEKINGRTWTRTFCHKLLNTMDYGKVIFLAG